MSLAARFWSKVKKGKSCWIWTAAYMSQKQPYGVFWFEGGNELAHRMAWRLSRGIIPEGFCVCHTCDNPSCVRPDHLFLGTTKDNWDDSYKKGRRRFPCGKDHWSGRKPECVPKGENHWTQRLPERIPRGEQRGHTKLTREAVVKARSEYDGRRGSLARVARKYGVTPDTMRKAILYQTWRHVP